MSKKMAVPRSQAVGPNSTRANIRHEQETDILSIGGGIMGATPGTWLQELESGWSIVMVEQISNVAEESSNRWNNAGAGHAALMELNYTLQIASGINIDKAIGINEAFRVLRQFRAHQVMRDVLNKPKSFISNVPHMSFVWGEDNANFLRVRYAALQQSELFYGIRYSEDHQQIKAWAPLVMEGRDPQQKVTATRTEVKTDADHGEITRQLVAGLRKHDNFSPQLGTVVCRFERNADKSWTVILADADDRRQKRVIKAKFIFTGAGGAASTLLQETGVPQAKEYASSPVGGQFLVCENPEVVNRHLAKIYSQAEVGALPMSMPRINIRIIDGKRVVLLGPFATFSTRFPKNGSLWDLLASADTSNVLPILNVGLDNFDPVKYLISQVIQKDKDRLAALYEYYPGARKGDRWLWQTGQRMRIIKRDAKEGGVLRLGTEVMSDDEGTVAAPFGASPSTSTAAPIMLQLMEKVFKDKVNSPGWQIRLKAIIPTYGIRLDDNPAKIERALVWTSEVLGLKYEPTAVTGQAPQAELKSLSGGKPMADTVL